MNLSKCGATVTSVMFIGIIIIIKMIIINEIGQNTKKSPGDLKRLQ